jgi:RND family efflux transporter MFP subunit
MVETLNPVHHTTESSPQHSPQRGPARLFGWFLVLFVVFLILGLYTLSQRRTEQHVLAEQTEKMDVVHVGVVHATPINTDSDMVLPASLNSYVQVPIYSRTDGYLKKWYKDIGSHVAKGDLLAEIDTPEVDQQLDQARADLNTAQANAKLSGTTASRYQQLFQSQVVSQQDVDNYAGDYSAKQAIVHSAEANVKRLEDLESFKRVYAPIAGVITQRNVDIGTLINAGNGGSAIKEMFDLAQTDPLRVYVSVPQVYESSIRSGLKACLQVPEFPGRDFCGQVVRTADAIDPGTRTLLTEVDVANPTGALLQGAYAQMHFSTKLPGQEITLPINALLFRPEGTMAAVVGPDGRLSLKKVTIGRDFGNTVEIVQGITQQDAVVIDPPDSLNDGQKVEVSAPDQEHAQAAPAAK